MSDIHNHTLCALRSQERLGNEELLRMIENHQSLYLFGAMGGDIFLYFHFLRGDAWAEQISERFHSDPDRLFARFAQGWNTAAKEEKEPLTAYLMGYVSHHALDAITHPFITYFAGFELPDKSETKRYRYTHKRLEVLLDVLYAEYLGQTPIALDFLNQITDSELLPVTKLMQSVLRAGKSELIPDNMLRLCLNDCKKLMRLSENRALFRLLRPTDLFGGTYHYTRPFFFAEKSERNLDAMNLSHRFWCHPHCPAIKMNYSYPELFAYGCKNSVKNMIRYYDYLKGSRRDINRIFHHSDFLLGDIGQTSCNEVCMKPILPIPNAVSH